jgi:heat shock protein HtpX
MWQQIRANKIKSIILAGFMFLILLLFGAVLLGEIGVLAAFMIWLIMLLVSYYQGDRLLLSVSGARRIEHHDLPALFNVVEEMKIASGLSHMPAVYLIDDPVPNAFAAGRSPEHACVAVTSGLLQRVNRDELQGVIAHELGHISNRDVLLMTVTGTMLGAIVMLADSVWRIRYVGGGRRSSGGGQGQAVILIAAVVFAILAPVLAQLIYFAVSRKREYLADACSAQYTRYPEGLAAALEKISAAPQQVRRANRVTAPMYIVNPFAGAKKKMSSLMSTHPPTGERVRILRGMAGSSSLDAYQNAFARTTGSGSRLFVPEELSAPAPGKAPARAAAASAGGAFTHRAATPLVQATPPASAPSGPVASRSSVNDVFWKQQGYAMVNCECGAHFKVPPAYKNRPFFCPMCGKQLTWDHAAT